VLGRTVHALLSMKEEHGEYRFVIEVKA